MVGLTAERGLPMDAQTERSGRRAVVLALAGVVLLGLGVLVGQWLAGAL